MENPPRFRPDSRAKLVLVKGTASQGSTAPTLARRRLGRTDLEVSKLGVGSAAFAGIYGRRDPRTVARTIERALELGINLVDTAPAYGAGVAEETLGTLLRGRRQRVVLSSKVGCWAGHEHDFAAPRLVKGVEESLRRLNTDYLDIVLLQDIEQASPERLMEEAWPAMAGLRDEGKVRAIGVSGYAIGVLAWAVRQLDVDVVLSSCRCTLHDLSIRQLARGCAEGGVGLLAASPVAMGLLTQSGPPWWHPAHPELKAAAKKAALACQLRGRDLAELALQFACSLPGVDAIITGTGSVGHLERNVCAARQAPDRVLLESVREIFGSVARNTWQTGLTEWQRIAPDGHDIHR